MVHYCCVYLCKNKISMNGISMHAFPKDPDIRKEWLRVVKREGRKSAKLSKCSKVCSAHFQPQDFLTGPFMKKRCLKLSAVPSIFAYTTDVNLDKCDASGSTKVHDDTNCEERKPEVVGMCCQDFVAEEKLSVTVKHEASLEPDTVSEEPLDITWVKEEPLDVTWVKEEPLDVTRVKEEPLDITWVNDEPVDVAPIKQEPEVTHHQEEPHTVPSELLLLDKSYPETLMSEDTVPEMSSRPTVNNTVILEPNEYIKIVDIQDIFKRKTPQSLKEFKKVNSDAMAESTDIPKIESVVSLCPHVKNVTDLGDREVQNMSSKVLVNSLSPRQNNLNLNTGVCSQCNQILFTKSHKCPITSVVPISALSPNVITRDALGNIKASKCTACNALFISDAALENHVKSDHPGIVTSTNQKSVVLLSPLQCPPLVAINSNTAFTQLQKIPSLINSSSIHRTTEHQRKTKSIETLTKVAKLGKFENTSLETFGRSLVKTNPNTNSMLKDTETVLTSNAVPMEIPNSKTTFIQLQKRPSLINSSSIHRTTENQRKTESTETLTKVAKLGKFENTCLETPYVGTPVVKTNPIANSMLKDTETVLCTSNVVPMEMPNSFSDSEHAVQDSNSKTESNASVANKSIIFKSAAHEKFYTHFCNYHFKYERNQSMCISMTIPHLIESLEPTKNSLGMFQCNQCKSMFRTTTKLELHLNSAHQNPDSVVKCKVCNFNQIFQICAIKEHLQKHTKHYQHFVEAENLWQCFVCERLSNLCLPAKDKRKYVVKFHFENITIMKNHSTDDMTAPNSIYFSYKLDPSLPRHIHVRNIFRCFQCPVTSESRDQNDIHIETHIDCVFTKCTVCGMKCENMDRYYQHINYKHWKLQILDIDFKNKNSKLYFLTNNMTCYKHPIPIKFHNNCSLQIHIGSQHQSTLLNQNLVNVNKLRCPICDVGFLDPKLFFAHCVPYTPLLPSLLQECTQCQLDFSTEEESEAHRQEVHGGVDSFCCRICNVAQNSPENLKIHVEERHNVPMFHCNICKSHIFSKQEVIIHLKMCHSVKRANKFKLVCPICGLICENSDFLINHIRIDFNMLPPTQQCKVCLNYFYSKFNLACHMLDANCNRGDTFFRPHSYMLRQFNTCAPGHL